MSRRTAFVAILSALLAALTAAGPASAHNWTSYYGGYNPTGNYYTTRWGQTMIPWQFGNGYAGSGQHWLDRAEEAVRTWSDATQGHILFSKVAADTTNATTHYCQGADGEGTSEVDQTGISVIRRHWTQYGVMGWTTLCFRNSGPVDGEWPITGFVMTITSNPRWRYDDGSVFTCGWYATLGTPADDQCDLASTVIHETGHAIGHGYHFDDPDPQAPYRDPSVCKPNVGDAGHQTMCTSAPPHSTFIRTLEDHDIHTLRDAYANWPPPPPPPPTTTTVTTPPSNGGGVPGNHCDTLDEPTDPIDAVRDAVTQPADGNLFGIPTCI